MRLLLFILLNSIELEFDSLNCNTNTSEQPKHNFFQCIELCSIFSNSVFITRVHCDFPECEAGHARRREGLNINREMNIVQGQSDYSSTVSQHHTGAWRDQGTHYSSHCSALNILQGQRANVMEYRP